MLIATLSYSKFDIIQL